MFYSALGVEPIVGSTVFEVLKAISVGFGYRCGTRIITQSNMPNTMSPDPATVVHADSTLRDLAAATTYLFGEDIGRRFAALVSDPARFVAAPATIRSQLHDLLREGRDHLEPTKENIERFSNVVTAIERLKELTRSNEECQSAASPAGLRTLAFLKESRGTMDVDTYRKATFELEYIECTGVLYPGLALLRQNVATTEAFETIARAVTDAMRRASESWYRPMLSAMLRLTLVRLGKTETINHELGKLMLQCRKTWSTHTGPLEVLSDRIRFVRNSESHQNTEIDVRSETITFVNRPPPPKLEERLGPLDRTAFENLAREFFQHCLSMRQAFAAVDPPR